MRSGKLVGMDARRERLTLLAMCFGLFMIMLDNTIVNVALPSPFAALILLGGKLGDRFGRRRMFVAGLAIFTAASACRLPVAARAAAQGSAVPA